MVIRAPNFRTLDLNLLRVFDQVMAERNLTRAARNLAMTQPAVSNALNRLREALGDRLVVRSGYGVEPTAAALADATAAEVMPGLVGIMEREAPGITVRTVPLTTRDPRRVLEEGTVDL